MSAFQQATNSDVDEAFRLASRHLINHRQESKRLEEVREAAASDIAQNLSLRMFGLQPNVKVACTKIRDEVAVVANFDDPDIPEQTLRLRIYLGSNDKILCDFPGLSENIDLPGDNLELIAGYVRAQFVHHLQKAVV